MVAKGEKIGAIKFKQDKKFIPLSYSIIDSMFFFVFNFITRIKHFPSIKHSWSNGKTSKKKNVTIYLNKVINRLVSICCDENAFHSS